MPGMKPGMTDKSMRSRPCCLNGAGAPCIPEMRLSDLRFTRDRHSICASRVNPTCDRRQGFARPHAAGSQFARFCDRARPRALREHAPVCETGCASRSITTFCARRTNARRKSAIVRHAWRVSVYMIIFLMCQDRRERLRSMPAALAGARGLLRRTRPRRCRTLG
jgi:hypothetical protein